MRTKRLGEVAQVNAQRNKGSERERREQLEKELPNDIWESEAVSTVFKAGFVALNVVAVITLLKLASPLISGTIQAFPSPPTTADSSST